MQVIREFNIEEDCWGGARDRIDDLTTNLLKRLIDILESDTSIFGGDPAWFENNIPTATEVNDFIWFEDNTYAEWLGFKDAEQLWNFCSFVKDDGGDEYDAWVDEDGDFYTEEEVIERFEDLADTDAYADWQEWAEENGFEKFDI